MATCLAALARSSRRLPRQAARFSTLPSAASPTPIPPWASPAARTAITGLLQRWHPSTPATDYTQTLDANQLAQLRTLVRDMVSLGGADEQRVERGTALSPGEHLVYFTPRVGCAALARDGSDPSFNPPGGVFTRRMWAGGVMAFARERPLRVGEDVRERTWVEDALVKRLRGGEEMLVVWIRKEYEVAGEVVLRDRRSWVFRQALASSPSDAHASAAAKSLPAAADVPPSMSSDTESTTLTVQQSPAALFRFSALTYNAHQIHLDAEWARTVEGHSDVVVHGPLNVLLLCRYWAALEQRQRRLLRVEYRAKSPVCAGERYVLRQQQVGREEDGDVLCAVREDTGQVIMEATMYSTL